MTKADRDAAFTEFVLARRTHLRRVAFAICGDWHRAEDILQAALVKLYVAWPRVQRDGREEAYVRQIIVRANIDEHRRPWRREHPGLDGHDAATSESVSLEDRTELFEALQELPPMQRRTVVLRHWLGLSVEETATALGIGQGTVKSHSSRGLERLQSVLSSRR